MAGSVREPPSVIEHQYTPTCERFVSHPAAATETTARAVLRIWAELAGDINAQTGQDEPATI